MNKNQFIIFFSTIVLITLIITNPSEQNHVEVVKSKLKVAFKKKMTKEMLSDESNSLESVGNGLGILLGDTFIDKMTDGFVSRNNYFLFSTTNVEYKDQSKMIGLGILGNVFVSDKIDNIFDENNIDKTDEKSQKDNELTKDYPDVKNKKTTPSQLDLKLINQINNPELIPTKVGCDNSYCNIVYEWSDLYSALPLEFQKKVKTNSGEYEVKINDLNGLWKGFNFNCNNKKTDLISEAITNTVGYENEPAAFRAAMVFLYVKYQLLKIKD
ncbi:DUF4359 domain-containing protein [Epilithonimonas hominis]|uniref:DUF4359 domain-containing protein n=1 Tax=Epilithonimonas hominis TaxID=420404 RepID=UPI00289EA45E|nr:DUF4359 domain-containing protein [Epilithonimonas hominis]